MRSGRRFPRSRRLIPALGVGSVLVACGALQVSPSAAQSEVELELGRQVFLLHCAICHGEEGDGYGERHYITYAQPRAFQSGRFKLATTENRVPSDADLIRTIELGMPGSGMPNWGWLPEAEVAAVARFVRHLGVQAIRSELAERVADGRLSAGEAEEILIERTRPGPLVLVPPEPDFSPDRRLRGERIYLEACASCHGADGRAAAGTVMTDIEGNWLPPPSFASGVYKGGSEPRQLYVRVLKGMDGTAMPGFETAYTADELWDVVHHVVALGQPGSGSGGSEETLLDAGRTLPVPSTVGAVRPPEPAIEWVEEAEEASRGRPIALGLLVGLAVVALGVVLVALALGALSR